MNERCDRCPRNAQYRVTVRDHSRNLCDSCAHFFTSSFIFPGEEWSELPEDFLLGKKLKIKKLETD